MTESEYLNSKNSFSSYHANRIKKLDNAIEKLDNARKEAEKLLNKSKEISKIDFDRILS